MTDGAYVGMTRTDYANKKCRKKFILDSILPVLAIVLFVTVFVEFIVEGNWSNARIIMLVINGFVDGALSYIWGTMLYNRLTKRDVKKYIEEHENKLDRLVSIGVLREYEGVIYVDAEEETEK